MPRIPDDRREGPQGPAFKTGQVVCGSDDPGPASSFKGVIYKVTAKDIGMPYPMYLYHIRVLEGLSDFKEWAEWTKSKVRMVNGQPTVAILEEEIKDCNTRPKRRRR